MHGRAAETPIVVKLQGPPPAGERLSVHPDPAHLHVFDAETGRRLEALA